MIQAVKHSLLTRVPGVQKLRIEPAYDSGTIYRAPGEPWGDYKEDTVYTFSGSEQFWVQPRTGAEPIPGYNYPYGDRPGGEYNIFGEYTLDWSAPANGSLGAYVLDLCMKRDGTVFHSAADLMQMAPVWNSTASPIPTQSGHGVYKMGLTSYHINSTGDGSPATSLIARFWASYDCSIRLQISWLEIEYREWANY